MTSPVTDKQIFANPVRISFTALHKRLHSSLSTYLKVTIFSTTFLLVGVSAFILHAYIINLIYQVPGNTLIGISAAYKNVLHNPQMIYDISTFRIMAFDIAFYLSALGLATLISGLIYSSISFHILQPLRMLANPGELEPSIDDENEIGQILRHIQRLEAALAIKEKELAVEHNKIDHLYSLQYNTENPPSLEKFFSQGLEIIHDITGFSAITLRLYEPGTQTFRIMAQSGMTLEMQKELQVIPADGGFHAEIFQTHKPAFTSDMSHDPRLSSRAPISAGYHSLACIPLLAQDILVGSMQLVTKEEYYWSASDRRWLGLIGRRIGLLIHQIQLSERLRDLAVLDERSRIAQEIHDGLSQLVGALRIWSEEALACLEDRELDNVQKTLEKIEDTASDAYASLREEILGLRGNFLANKDLSACLSDYLCRFQHQWGLQVELQVDQRVEDLDPLSITPAAKIQLLRIFQEGLTNVRRHANASRIIVALSCGEGFLTLQIQDDGVGFDLHSTPADRFGLRIMRERAASAGGTGAIKSQIGQGTQLETKIPLRVF